MLVGPRYGQAEKTNADSDETAVQLEYKICIADSEWQEKQTPFIAESKANENTYITDSEVAAESLEREIVFIVESEVAAASLEEIFIAESEVAAASSLEEVFIAESKVAVELETLHWIDSDISAAKLEMPSMTNKKDSRSASLKVVKDTKTIDLPQVDLWQRMKAGV